jgi:hypothetical protein
MASTGKTYITDPNVIKIDWHAAEQLLGHRVDRRFAYWRRGSDVFVYTYHAGYFVNDPERNAELHERWRLLPYKDILT